MSRFKIEDREYDFDGEYTAAEAMLYFDKAGIGLNELNAALERGNPYVLVTLMYILKTRAGEKVRWQDLMHLPVSAFSSIPDDNDGAADDGETGDGPGERTGETLDPTKDGGTTPEPDTATTS